MAIGQLSTFLRQLRECATRDSAAQLPDRQLLADFVRAREEDAFAALVARHGPMVLSVCRRILRDPQAAEDAFQATFLVLVRKAATIQKGELLSQWLYGTAYRTACRARVEAARRQQREKCVPPREPADPLAEITVRELCAVVDQELFQLPAAYRTPLILCYLQGRTRDEAARQLGWSPATLGRRLERGRQLMQHRLSRRGLTLSVALLPALLTPSATAAALSPGLVGSTVQAGLCVAQGQMAASAVAPGVISLMEGVIRAMAVKKLTRTLAMVLFLSVLVPSAVLWWPCLFPQGQAAQEPAPGRVSGQATDMGQPKTAGKGEEQPVESAPVGEPKPGEEKPQPKSNQPPVEGEPKGKEKPEELVPGQKPSGEPKAEPKKGSGSPKGPREQPMEDNYCKMEIRGTLLIRAKSQTGWAGLDNQPLGAVIHTGQVGFPLFFHGNKELIDTARRLDGKTVLLTGKLQRHEAALTASYKRPGLTDYVTVVTLRSAGPPPAFPHKDDSTAKLIQDLDRDNAFARAAAIDLLGQRKAWEAIPKLIDLLTDGTPLAGSDNWVGGRAAIALAVITGRPFDTNQEKWRQWWKQQKKRGGR
jgi:RNA polymerase sigma factor (sigma-70 family)